MEQNNTLNVSEIFYSLQGEGNRSGTPTFFIRLQGCKAQGACYASGIRCDTEFESGSPWELEKIHTWMLEANKDCKEITWTGGEPLDQLNVPIVKWFKDKGYFQAVETSGLFPCPEGIDFICISPKVAEHVVKKNYRDTHVHELRYVRHQGQEIPNPKIEADHYWVSPHSDGYTINNENVLHCIKLCLDNPKWKLSVQDHKLWNIL